MQERGQFNLENVLRSIESQLTDEERLRIEKATETLTADLIEERSSSAMAPFRDWKFIRSGETIIGSEGGFEHGKIAVVKDLRQLDDAGAIIFNRMCLFVHDGARALRIDPKSEDRLTTIRLLENLTGNLGIKVKDLSQ